MPPVRRGPPLGVFLVLRRMSLMSDVLQHGVLPGIAVGAASEGCRFGRWGPAVWWRGWRSRCSPVGSRGPTGGARTASSPGLYLVALAAGVALISAQSGVDLTHLLFGSVLAVDDTALLAMAGRRLTLPVLAVIWRPMVLERSRSRLAGRRRRRQRWNLAQCLPRPRRALRRRRVRGAWHADVGRS